MKTTKGFYLNKKKFIGQDKQFMCNDKLLDYNNYCISRWKLENQDSLLYDYAINKYINEIKNPKSKFRLVCKKNFFLFK